MKKIFTPLLFCSIFFVIVSLQQKAKAQTRAVYFTGYNSSTASFPRPAAGFNSAVVSAGVINYSGLLTVNDSRTVWNNPNTSATLDIGTAPYLSYTITMN